MHSQQPLILNNTIFHSYGQDIIFNIYKIMNSIIYFKNGHFLHWSGGEGTIRPGKTPVLYKRSEEIYYRV